MSAKFDQCSNPSPVSATYGLVQAKLTVASAFARPPPPLVQASFMNALIWIMNMFIFPFPLLEMRP